MSKNRFKRRPAPRSDQDRRRRRREIFLIFAIIGVMALVTYLEKRLIYFGPNFQVSNTVLMFILININLLLLILLIFLVFRNLVKLLYDRKRKVMGAKLRTRLVIAFVSLTLLPTSILFFFSINFITNSIEFWFNIPIEQALENSLSVGRQLYTYAEDHNRFFLRRIAYQIRTRDLLAPGKRDALAKYIRIVQREFNLHAVEVYDASARRLVFIRATPLRDLPFPPMQARDLLKSTEAKAIRSFSENSPAGELSRSPGAIPFGTTGRAVRGFVVVSALLPPTLSENLLSISRGVEEYSQIKLLKRPIRVTYYLILSIVSLLVVFCAIWFGFYLAKSISVPIRELAEGTRRVAEGDLGFSITRMADDEIGSLVDSFNKMTRELRANRSQLELSARMLRQQNTEIEARRQYMEIVLKNVSTGVISFDAGGFVITTNTSAEKMLSIRSDEISNKSYKKLLRDQHLEVADEVMEKLAASRDNTVEMPLRLTISGRPRSFLVHVSGLRNDAGHHIGLVVVFDDLTDQEKAQRMAAWREVARRIAHEVKNPLTPISLSAQRLKRKYAARIDEPVFEECTRMIIDQVELIRNLVNEFSRFARFPTANPMLCDLPPIIRETVALYREGLPDILFELRMPEDLVQLNLDRQQMKQALINLIDNAISAMKHRGHITFTVTHDAILKIVRMEVADDGPGISGEDKTRLFEPYFSTKKTGMGLGLTIVSSIIADHNGMIRVQDNQPRGTKFIIELPV
ncbi:PAS domain-containing sensor histidine kinase [Desulfonema ishimotonii]|uniref:histidine kinase n=2 Tax=Desulfonema ishimotonii TaxID=45657 RepID=A0A401G111_9BACT|nr:ATP-binding protein [Desulfonema ishimotonii]GBC62895.1 PAS domain-containing sensor histidine kinase [Desulfonema ishimotonii]